MSESNNDLRVIIDDTCFEMGRVGDLVEAISTTIQYEASVLERGELENRVLNLLDIANQQIRSVRERLIETPKETNKQPSLN